MRVDKVAWVFDDPCDVSHMGAGVSSMLAFAGASGHLFKLQQSLLVHADYKKRGESALSHSLFTVRIQSTNIQYMNFCCLGCSWTIFQWTELFLSCQHFSVQCCFMSTETIRLIRNGEPRTATSTFTQLLSSDLVRCYFASIYRFVRSASLSGWSCLTPGDTWISYKSHFRTEAHPQMVRCM